MKWTKVENNQFVVQITESYYQAITITLDVNGTYVLRHIDCDLSLYTDGEIAEATKGKIYSKEYLVVFLSEYFDNFNLIFRVSSQWKLFDTLSSETGFNMPQISELQLHDVHEFSLPTHMYKVKVTAIPRKKAMVRTPSIMMAEIELPFIPFIGLTIDNANFSAVIEQVTWDGNFFIVESEYVEKKPPIAPPIVPPVYKWADLSDTAKNILEWTENPRNDKLETLVIEKGKQYDRFGIQVFIDEALFEEIRSYIVNDNALNYAFEIEGNTITVSLK
jgi:hypothetical protein